MASSFVRVSPFRVFSELCCRRPTIFWYRSPLQKWGCTKAYLQCVKFGGPSWDENSLSSLIRFDVITTDAVDAFSLSLGLDLNIDNVLDHVRALDSLSLHFVKSSVTLGRTTPQESFRRIKFLLPGTGANILFHCYLLFCANDLLIHTDCDLQICVFRERTTKQRLNSESGEHSLCLQIPVTGQFHILLNMQSFNDYICDRIRNVRDCYILYSYSLDKSSEPFWSITSLELVYDSNERTEPKKK